MHTAWEQNYSCFDIGHSLSFLPSGEFAYHMQAEAYAWRTEAFYFKQHDSHKCMDSRWQVALDIAMNYFTLCIQVRLIYNHYFSQYWHSLGKVSNSVKQVH